jgi:response regulator NasT
VVLVPAGAGPECLGLAVLSARAAQARQRGWQSQLEQLQQRLNDRIVIERAKGVLVQRLGIPEEEAYKRLRVLSRRQRRQIRDIAQSLLDAQALLTPESNGNGFVGNGHPHPEEADTEHRTAGPELGA